MAQTHEVRGVATSVSYNPPSVIYHGTEVFRLEPDRIILDTGGWFTATTKLRMNQAMNQFGLNWSIYQERGKWYAWNRSTGLKVPFDQSRIALPRP